MRGVQVIQIDRSGAIAKRSIDINSLYLLLVKKQTAIFNLNIYSVFEKYLRFTQNEIQFLNHHYRLTAADKILELVNR